jgi:Family of unknown function (DUF6064)
VKLPFTPDQFFDVFAAYNRSLWPVALALWVLALASAIALAMRPHERARFILVMLAVQWLWAGMAYHAAFFTAINPAAWLFSALFVAEGGMFAGYGLARNQMQFRPAGSPRHVVAWTLILYALLYPLGAQMEGHAFPRGPTFGVPCPTTLLTVGLLLAVTPLPVVLAVIPILWCVIGGSAAFVLGVRTDLMLIVAGIALTISLLSVRAQRARVNQMPEQSIEPT